MLLAYIAHSLQKGRGVHQADTASLQGKEKLASPVRATEQQQLSSVLPETSHIGPNHAQKLPTVDAYLSQPTAHKQDAIAFVHSQQPR